MKKTCDPNAPNPNPTLDKDGHVRPGSIVALMRRQRVLNGGSGHPLSGRRKRLNAIMKREREDGQR